MDVDIFISHASEDKHDVATPLAKALEDRGYKVWYDQFMLTIGCSLRREIDKGLASCRFGIVVLSPSFFAKEWPQKELDALTAREAAGHGQIILPVWHDLDRDALLRFSPILADRVGVSTSKGIKYVVDQIVSAIEAFIRPTDSAISGTRSAEPLLRSFPVEVLLLGAGPDSVASAATIKPWAHHPVRSLIGTFWSLAHLQPFLSTFTSIEQLNEKIAQQPKMPSDLEILDWTSLRKLPKESSVGAMPKPRVALII